MKGHADLPPWDARKHAWRVVIETPQGSTAKYHYDREHGVYTMSHILPEGTVFPYAFGFLPATRGDDGDPLDVLLLNDGTTYCGCVVLVRIIGVIEGKQVEKDQAKPVRNDRFLAVPLTSRRYAPIKSARRLPKEQIKDFRAFFEDYNRTLGRSFTVTKWTGPGPAEKLIERGRRKYHRHGGHRKD